ncbi:MAG: molybdate ABC transporter permease subunit [Saprospiraceae bacterium]|nr:molybdate ABC transporter permease subunit [Saprospiraceae bacterium]
MDWQPLILTFELAVITTILLFIISLPLSYWLAFTQSRLKPVIESFISMPLVLPPTVLGFYLLIAFSPNGGFGSVLKDYLGLQLIFSFEGLVLASIIYSMPFMVHSIQSGFKQLDPALKEASYILGKGRWETLWRVLLPNIKPSILTGVILSFAHTIGEFGVVLMIGGSIPGVTKVASIEIYDRVESLDYAGAHFYSMILFVVSFIVLLLVYSRNGNVLKFSNHA